MNRHDDESILRELEEMESQESGEWIAVGLMAIAIIVLLIIIGLLT